MLRVNEFAKLLYDTSSGCSQGEAVRVYTDAFLDVARLRKRLSEIAECGCTARMLDWPRADVRQGLSCTPEDRCSPCRCREFLTPSGEAATRERVATVDPCEGKPGDVLATTGGDVSASPDRALPDGWVHGCNCQGDHAPPACRPDDANRYHQRLGAKWMCEALVRWLRTSGLACAADIERRWEDDAFWRPETTR